MMKESKRISGFTQKLGKIFIYRHHIEQRSSIYVAKEESFLISKIHIIERNTSEKKYTMRRENWRKAQISEENKCNCIDIAGKDGILHLLTTLRKNSFS